MVVIAATRAQGADLADWWWSLDRVLMGALVALVAIGVLLSLAASPAAAARLSISDPFHFLYRHGFYAALAVLGMLVLSTLSNLDARRLAVVATVGALILTAATLEFGYEVKGATRWLHIGSFSLQPSEFLKPAFIVSAAWLFAEQRRGAPPAAGALAVMVYFLSVALLMMQPDFGQTVLLTVAFGALFFLAGLPILWTALLGACAMIGSFAAYRVFPHVTERVNGFLNPEAGETYQVDRAMEAFSRGGLFGVGPGEGIVKASLPDAYSDFIFAVAAEEFGLVACLIIAGLFAVVVWRGLRAAYRLADPFLQLAVAGLTLLIGLQAFINMAVNLSLVPPKGMTLPFISYGGSSMLATAFTAGLLLAFTRRRPGVYDRGAS
jgi:cell division protein FtsW